LVHETGAEEAINGYSYLRSVLQEMSKRWAVAGEYIKVLEVCFEPEIGKRSLIYTGCQGESISGDVKFVIRSVDSCECTKTCVPSMED
jgi:hypothetical protein